MAATTDNSAADHPSDPDPPPAGTPPDAPATWPAIELSLQQEALRLFLCGEGLKIPPASSESPSHIETETPLPESATLRINISALSLDDGLAWHRGWLELPGLTVSVGVRIYQHLTTATERELVRREMRAFDAVKHPRFLPVLGSCTMLGMLVTVMPDLVDNDICTYLKGHPEADRRRLIIQVAEGLEFLHTERLIVHGDLKASTVFVNPRGDAVIGEFLLSTTIFKEPDASPTTTPIRQMVTLRYAAPELFADESHDSSGRLRSKTLATDMYAFGVLIYEVLSGRTPWAELPTTAVIMRVVAGHLLPRPDDGTIDDVMWDICVGCWASDPTSRPTITSVMASLRRSILPSQRGLDAGDAVDHNHGRHGEQAARDDLGSPTHSRYHTPGTSPTGSSWSFYTGASWASTPRRATSLSNTTDLIEEVLPVEINGAVAEIVLPAQKAVKGGSGKVMKGYALIDGAVRVFAVKICQDQKVMPREYGIWKSLLHDNILPLSGVIESRAAKPLGSRECVFVSPYMNGGNLVGYLKLNPLAQRLCLMIDVAAGLEYLHNIAQVVHGDIKAENVLVADNGRALLADFGLSTTIAPAPQITALYVRQMYTLAYCAPEIVDENAEDPSAPGIVRSKTKMSDMYAYGVLLYQTYTGGLGRTQGARLRLMADMYEGRFPPRPTGRLPVLCDDLWTICTRCWTRSALDRPAIATVLAELRDISPERQMIEEGKVLPTYSPQS